MNQRRGIRAYETPTGWIGVVRVNGKTVRHRRKSEAAALAWAKAKYGELVAAGRPLTADEAADYRAAVRRLPPGKTLADAVDVLLGHGGPSDSLEIGEAVDQYLSNCMAAKMRPTTIYGKRWGLKKLSAPHVGSLVSDLRYRDVAEVLDRLAPVTRNNVARIMYRFFTWATKAGYCIGNPLAAVDRAKIDEAKPALFTPDEARALLKHADEMTPVIALGLFAGIRTEALWLLDWSSIGPDKIEVPGHADKLRRRRFVEIQTNLAKWLAPYRRASGRVCPHCKAWAGKRISKIAEAAGVAWKHNAMRHSFPSYLLELKQDAAYVAKQMGHASPETFYRHYRELVTKQDAKAWFSIIPKAKTVSKPSRETAKCDISR